MNVIGTGWSLVPALVAIVLALITKEVYSSLFVGILFGGLLFTGFNLVATVEHVFVDGMIGQLSDPWNVGILIFLVILGAMVQLMNRAGGSAAFGRWAATHVKSRTGAQIATIVLGILIFIDDYFNCLTVGSVMRPVTEKFGISRAKLAYLIDATAAPVCIIAPISSWAAAVTGFVDGVDGLTLFIKAIPYNYYAWLTIFMMFILAIGDFDYGKMRILENATQFEYKNDQRPSITGADEQPDKPASQNGTVAHLIVPIAVLIVSCVAGMIYTGGFFEGAGFAEAFSGSNASTGLVFGSVTALIITVIFFIASRVITFKDAMNCIPDGFKAMVPAILILTFAWTLKSMTDSLGSDVFVDSAVRGFIENSTAASLVPAFVFIIGCVIAFATGTSWGTFGILIPIVVKVFQADMSNTLMIISISACMAGAVCGDHCSPISDTTIMASAGSGCDHVDHVSSQLPYALTIAVLSLVSYVFAGFVKSAVASMTFAAALTLVSLLILKERKLVKGAYK